MPGGVSRKALVVKSDGPERRRLVEILERAGYRVATADDGLDALSKVDEARPDVILADLVLDRLDGMALLRAFRSRPETRSLPVVVVTAVAEPSRMIETISSGARFFLVEPVQAESLLAKLDSLFG